MINVIYLCTVIAGTQKGLLQRRLQNTGTGGISLLCLIYRDMLCIQVYILKQRVRINKRSSAICDGSPSTANYKGGHHYPSPIHLISRSEASGLFCDYDISVGFVRQSELRGVSFSDHNNLTAQNQ